jgi:1-deoxy-D-xylulose 5-phosphate reductoisomerase
MKRLSILGSTGSIGRQTMEIVRRYPEEFSVVALAANASVELLEEQVREFRPRAVCVYDRDAARDLRERLRELAGTTVTEGMEGLLEIAAYDEADMTVVSVVGMIGIRPTIAAIKAGKTVALANKETLVTAGHIIIPLLRKHGVSLYPIDSEHSAIFQSLQTLSGDRDSFFEGHPSVKRILLTASGGPFRGRSREEMAGVTVEQTLCHPNWLMGRKITVDSATMANKGLEMMEARWLFGLRPDQIQVVIHPQSVLHSAVEFNDGAVIGQMGTPDMRLPIEYAVCYPQRKERIADALDLFAIGKLEFLEPDFENFPALALARDVLERDAAYGQMTGTTLPVVYNAANEFAVARFLKGECGFLDIPAMIRRAVEGHRVLAAPSLEQILESERQTYELLKNI